jgi:hypothetical protein
MALVTAAEVPYGARTIGVPEGRIDAGQRERMGTFRPLTMRATGPRAATDLASWEGGGG